MGYQNLVQFITFWLYFPWWSCIKLQMPSFTHSKNTEGPKIQKW